MSVIRALCLVVGYSLVFGALSSSAFALDIRPSRVPELNPGSAASALTLLASGMALIMARRSK